MKKILILIISVLLIGISGVYFYSGMKQSHDMQVGEKNDTKDIVLGVGNYTFSQKDLQSAIKLIKFYYPQDTGEISSLSRLVEGYIYVSILDTLGKPITNDLIEQEMKRIDETTLNTSGLKKIKDIFQNDEELYKKIAIVPDFANSYFHYTVFPNLELVTKQAKQEALQVLAILQKGGNIEQKIHTLQFSIEKGFQPIESGVVSSQNIERKKTPQEILFEQQIKQQINKESKKYEDEIFSQLQQGEWFSQLIEKQEGYDLVRWVEKTQSGRIVEMVSFPKKSSFEYFEKQKNTVPVFIKDDNLRNKFIKDIPWAKELYWNKN